MCGIVVYASSAGATPAIEITNDSIDKIKHRGPDGSGTASISVNGGTNVPTVVLGHTRLAIVGNDTARQPLKCTTPQRNFYLVHNGEVYNYRDLQERLIVQGCCTNDDFESGGDSEVLLACLAHKGVEWTLEKMRGMYAFVLVETSSATTKEEFVRIVACRDTFGIKPLCYAFDESQENLLFTSEVGAVPDNFGDVRDVLPSSILEITFRRGSWRRQERMHMDPRSWLSSEARNIQEVCDDAKMLASIRTKLIDAVSVRIPEGVRMGVLLSGGLDSSLIASIAADLVHPTTLHTFNIKYSGAVGDSPTHETTDYHYARLVGEEIPNICHEQLSFSFQEGISILPKVIMCLESADPSIVRAGVPLYILSKKVSSKGFKVVLCGEGADESFAGYRLFEKFHPISHDDCDQFDKELSRRLLHIDTSELQRVDRCTSAHGIEARVPFMDVDLIKTAMGISLQEKMSHPALGRIQKYILRRSFDRECSQQNETQILSDLVLYREKEQFADGVGRGWIAELQEYALTLFPSMDPAEAECALYTKFFDLHKNPGKEHLVESRKVRRRQNTRRGKAVETGSSQPNRWYPVRMDPDLQQMNLTNDDAIWFLENVLQMPIADEFCPDLNNLNKLIVAMLECVPFHNLTLLTRERRPPTMDEIKKDMMLGIGGPCSVVNSFFAVLLDVLGFGPHVYLLSCQINGRDDCHVAILVQVKGLRYFVDVANAKPYDRAVHLGDSSALTSLGGSFQWSLRYNDETGMMQLRHSDQVAIAFHPAQTVQFNSFRTMIIKSRSRKTFGPFLTGLRFCLYPKKASRILAVRDACIFEGLSTSHKRSAMVRQDIELIAEQVEFRRINGFGALVKNAIEILDHECPEWFLKSCEYLNQTGSL